MSIRFPSLCSIENGHPFVPTCRLAERRAQRQSRMPTRNAAAPAKPAQSVLDRASTVLRLSWRHYTTTVSRGVIALLFSLDNWWEVLSLQHGVCCEPNFFVNIRRFGPVQTGAAARTGFDDRQAQVYRAPSQAGPGNDINAGSPGFQKAPTRGPASLVAFGSSRPVPAMPG